MNDKYYMFKTLKDLGDLIESWEHRKHYFSFKRELFETFMDSIADQIKILKENGKDFSKLKMSKDFKDMLIKCIDDDFEKLEAIVKEFTDLDIQVEPAEFNQQFIKVE